MTEDDTELDEEAVQPVYYYNRQKRLAHAPEAVQKAWSEGYTPQKGFIRGLTANAGLRSILFAIVILCIAIVFVSLFGRPEGTSSIEGFDFKLKAFLYDETVFITVSSMSDIIHDGPVPILVILKGLDISGEIVTEATIEGLFTGNELVLRTTMRDYEIKDIYASINVKKTTLDIQVSVDRT